MPILPFVLNNVLHALFYTKYLHLVYPGEMKIHDHACISILGSLYLELYNFGKSVKHYY